MRPDRDTPVQNVLLSITVFRKRTRPSRASAAFALACIAGFAFLLSCLSSGAHAENVVLGKNYGADPSPEAAGTAVSRFTPCSYKPGEPLQVSILVTPGATSHAHAVEDRPPVGWTVSSVNEGGEFDAVNGKVKWGPFLDTSVRTLAYAATPPAGESGTKSFAGLASFDGTSTALTGDRVVSSTGCDHNQTGLKLSSDRVLVTLKWRNQYSGATGVGTPVKQMDQYGYFWFDSPANPEVFVKVLDFGGDSFLVFHSALSDLEYTVSFTVARTGQTYSFLRPAGSVCGLADGVTVKK